MTIRFALSALCVAAAALAAPLCQAESYTASTALSLASRSVGSLSDSLETSSQSSSDNKKMAEGRYRITDVAQVDGKLRLALQPEQAEAQGPTAWVTLPQPIVTQQGLVRGDTLHVAQRPYGLALQATEQAEPFFLLVTQAWLDERASRPVQL